MQAIAVLLTVWSFATPAHAQPAPEEEGSDEGREVFELGRRAYEDRRYDDAIRYFERALALSGRGELHYNIASAYERAGRRDDAIAAFERFVAAAPGSERRREAEERLRVLREGTESETPEHVEIAEPEGGSVAGPIVVLGLGVAAAATGAVLLGLAAGAKSTVEDAPRDTPWVDVEGDASNAETFSLVGAIALGVGAAAMVAGIVWLVAGSGSDDESSVAVTPFGFGGSF
jgi:tetratricopeptide (TPR) repeat protein